MGYRLEKSGWRSKRDTNRPKSSDLLCVCNERSDGFGGKAPHSPDTAAHTTSSPMAAQTSTGRASWELPEANAEAAAALIRAQAEMATRSVPSVDGTVVPHATHPPTITTLADDVAGISLEESKENDDVHGNTISPLEALMTAKANGVATAHRALLALASPAAFTKAPEEAAVATGTPTKPDNAGRVRATKEAYADSQRREAAERRERIRRAERAKEASKLRDAALAAEAASKNAPEPTPEARARMEAETARAAEAQRVKARKAKEAERAGKRVKAVEALQETVKRALARKGIKPPPLCGCPHAKTAQPFAMDHVYKCARNCPLRGDEGAYQAALAQMLAAHDIVITPPPLPV